MRVSDAVREVALAAPGVPIPVADSAQAFEYQGTMAIPHSAVIAVYLVDENGLVYEYIVQPTFRMRIPTGREPENLIPW